MLHWIKRRIRASMPSRWISRYHYLWALLGAFLYWMPSRRLVVIGVTGTKGKTSTVHYVAKVLEACGYKVGVISGLYFKIGSSVHPNPYKMTMPGRLAIPRLLRYMVYAGCTHAVIEVTSEGIAQYRHAFIDFDTAVLTNIAPEHIESHGSFEKYVAAKLELFTGLAHAWPVKNLKGKLRRIPKTIIVNGDDPRAEQFLSCKADRKISCHVGAHALSEDALSPHERLIAEKILQRSGTTECIVRGVSCTVRIPGRFNVSNALLAVAVGLCEGGSLPRLVEAVQGVRELPGRMERIVAGNGARIVIDYAHTPDSLNAVYETLRAEMAQDGQRDARLLCLLGAAGGGRDKWKRPLLGAVAGVWADEVIITNEDPYDEDPQAIMRDVAAGMEDAPGTYSAYFKSEPMEFPRKGGQAAPMRIIPDRRVAIREILKKSGPGDIIAITGKGAESSIAVQRGRKVRWDDRQVVREELARLGHK